jgi:hypothetical protein
MFVKRYWQALHSVAGASKVQASRFGATSEFCSWMRPGPSQPPGVRALHVIRRSATFHGYTWSYAAPNHQVVTYCGRQGGRSGW